MHRNADRMRLDADRYRAAQFLAEKYSREERYLKIFARDFAAYLKSSDYIMSRDTANQFYFDFLCSFDSLKEKMSEFRWSADYLKANGIDFKAIRKLYFAVA